MVKFALTLMVVMLLIQCTCFSQGKIIGAAGELHIGAGYNLPVGAKSVNGVPSLLANMEPGLSFESRFMKSVSRKLSLGVWAGFVGFDSWSSNSSSLYKGSSISLHSGGGSVMYKPWAVTGSRRRLNFFLSLSSGVSSINVTTSEESEINGGTKPDPLTVRSVRFTMGTFAGAHYLINHSFGATLLAGYQYTAADSQVFPDTSFSYVTARASVFYRLFKDKKYKYSEL